MKQKHRAKIRLFVEQPLAAGAPVGLGGSETHYLRHVMRCKAGDEISLFNGRQGEWVGRIDGYGKAWTSIAVERQLRNQNQEISTRLIFAVIKRSHSDFLIQKATELGVTHLQPVTTRRSQAERFNPDRALAVAREAAEQSQRLSLPEILPLVSLQKVLEAWPETETLWFCDEGAALGSFAEALLAAADGSEKMGGAGILIGPEGGFEPEERTALYGHSFVRPVSLGPRILRAETAALASLAILQSVRGIS